MSLSKASGLEIFALSCLLGETTGSVWPSAASHGPAAALSSREAWSAPRVVIPMPLAIPGKQ